MIKQYLKVKDLFEMEKIMQKGDTVEEVKGKFKVLIESFNNTGKDELKIKESDFVHISRKLKDIEFMIDNISNLNNHFIPMYERFKTDSIEMMRYGASYSLPITSKYSPFDYNFFNDLVEDQDFWELVKLVLQSKVMKSYYEYEEVIREGLGYEIGAAAYSLKKSFGTNDYYLMQNEKVFDYFRKSIHFMAMPPKYGGVTDFTLNVYINSNYLKVATNFAEDYSKVK